MDGLQFPILMLTLTLILGGGMLLFLKGSKKKKSAGKSMVQQTANEFINVKDIRDHFLYTRDNMILAYARIHKIYIDLLSKTEQITLKKLLTAELSDIQYPYSILAVSCPADISQIIEPMQDRLADAEDKQKELLRQEILEMGTYAISGENVERQFYAVVWLKYEADCEREFYKRISDFAGKFSNCGVPCDVLEQQEIIRLCNLVHNPSYHLEDFDTVASIPILQGGVADGQENHEHNSGSLSSR